MVESSDACVVTVVVVVEEVEVVTAFEPGPFVSGPAVRLFVVCPPTAVGGSGCCDPLLDPLVAGVELSFGAVGAAESDGDRERGEEGTGADDGGAPPVGSLLLPPEQAVARRPMDSNTAHAHSPGRRATLTPTLCHFAV